MAGDWLKWVKGLSRRREVLVIARKLGISRREAACCCMEVWEWADDETTDGTVLGATAGDIDGLLDMEGFVSAMCAPDVGWLLVSDAGISFPGYEKNNGETAKKRAEESRKRRNRRELLRRTNVRQKADKCPSKHDHPLLFSSLPLLLNTEEFKKRLKEWLDYKAERRETYKAQGLASMISRAEHLAGKHGVSAVMEAMQRAIANHWQGWDQPGSFGGSNANGNRPTSTRVGPGQRYRGD